MAVPISSFPTQNEMKMLQLFLSAPLVVVFATRLSPKIRIAIDAHKFEQTKVIFRPEKSKFSLYLSPFQNSRHGNVKAQDRIKSSNSRLLLLSTIYRVII